MVPSLNVKDHASGEWKRLFDVTYSEMRYLRAYNVLLEDEDKIHDQQHDADRYFVRPTDEQLDTAIRDIYAEKESRIMKQMKLDLMLIAYRIRAWTDEGDEFLW